MEPKKLALERPLVSIVVRTAGDRPRFLADALMSVAAQTYPRMETVLVWDSDDRHAFQDWLENARAAHFLKREGFVFSPVYCGQRNRSLAAGAGVAAADGLFVGLLDDDDALRPDHVERLMGALDADRRKTAATAPVALTRRVRTLLSEHARLSTLKSDLEAVASSAAAEEWEKVSAEKRLADLAKLVERVRVNLSQAGIEGDAFRLAVEAHPEPWADGAHSDVLQVPCDAENKPISPGVTIGGAVESDAVLAGHHRPSNAFLFGCWVANGLWRFDPDLEVCEDWFALLRVVRSGRRLLHVPGVSAEFRVRNDGTNALLRAAARVGAIRQEARARFVGRV